MAALAELFALTGGPDPSAPVVQDTEPTEAFLRSFSTAQFTGANGSGPILNANANLLPTRADNYRDTSSFNDFKLYNGLGVARAYSKADSQGGQVTDGFYGLTYPNKNFGRSTKSHDLVYNRDDLMERARMGLKKMGFKNDETPTGADLKPWVWNNQEALGIGQGHQYNRNYSMPDADAVYRRLYEPAPSRKTKMLSTDIETVSLIPSRTMLHPMKVFSEDRTREQLQRMPRNTDVIESVTYENIQPRGMGPPNGQTAAKVWAESSVLRQPVGTNDTGDKSVYDIWRAPFHSTDPLASVTLEDRLTQFRDDARFVRGQKIDEEAREFAETQRRLDAQEIYDPNEINPRSWEYPHNVSGTSTQLRMVPAAGRTM